MLCSLYYGRSVINVGMVYVCVRVALMLVYVLLLYGFIWELIIQLQVHMMVNHLKNCTLLLVR